MGIRAVEAGIIKLSPDQRTFTWGSTNRQLATVPYEENPYSAFNSLFSKQMKVQKCIKQLKKDLNKS